VGIRGERLADNGTPTRHHVEYVRGQDLIAQLDDADHRERRGFTRLQHDRVRDRKRRRDLSARVNGRPVEGDYCADNPEWFQHRRRVDAAVVVKVAAG